VGAGPSKSPGNSGGGIGIQGNNISSSSTWPQVLSLELTKTALSKDQIVGISIGCCASLTLVGYGYVLSSAANR
jgi:hypothetical protein